MVENTSLRNQFLVAMPGMVDGNFDHTVTLLCEHTPEGAMGLVINRPTTLDLRDMLQHMGIPIERLDGEPIPVYWGGPVQPERGFVLHSSEAARWDSTLKLSDAISVTTSKDILVAISQGQGPAHYLVTLGYAGWSAGQLEQEILHNSWLNTPADSAIVFETPTAARWEAAARLLGVDVRLLGTDPGHA
ncbi:MAG TPA: YqgE/AlgH family protein [Nevskiales bacterium]|nr:YqgE/AlgH family protein [Nevskiales bacterium]